MLLTRTAEAYKLIKKSHRWQRTAIAAAATALLALSAGEVFALSLGRITVQSALGEALRAEIDIPDINAEEAASIKANAAAPSAFTAAGLEFNPALTSLQAKLARRNDGRAYLQLSTDRPINEPFIDIILEASWSSGRIVRDYTLLFDPAPSKAAPAAPTLAQTGATQPQPSAEPSPAASMPKLTIPAEMARGVAAPAKSAPAVSKMAPKAATKPDATGERRLTVKPGDTASKIAALNKPADVSLDQMLVALMRSNPDAFSNGNLNRLRAGAVLDLPSESQAQETPAAQASQMVVAQSKDFNAYRRNLANSVPKAALETPNRKASGSVEARVEDKKMPSAVPDKLTLSKGALQAKKTEAQIAQERADRDAAARAAELSKNISELNKLNAAATKGVAEASAASAATKTTSSPALPLEVAALPANPASAAASAAASAPQATASAPASAPAPVTSAPAKPKMPMASAPAPMPEASSGLIDQLLDDPVLPATGLGAVLALIGGLFFYRRKQAQKNAAHVDSSFLESRLQPDSFFGASGGQRVDTARDNPASASSMVYSASQLDAADDVDPVAEADVYLAYGRDLQAEEILKEALRHNPGRLAIHTKLLEIYAKRRDTASFQASANQAFALTGANSPDWVRICEQGLLIDPNNPLYQPGGATVSAFGALEPARAEVPDVASTLAMPTHGEPERSAGNLDLDLDLDFSDDAPTASIVKPVPAVNPPLSSTAMATEPDSEMDSNGIDFDISGQVPMDTPAPASRPAVSADTSFSMDGLSLDLSSAPTQAGSEAGAPHASAQPHQEDDGSLQFDLGSLSLDLDDLPLEPAHTADSDAANSHETKLALAEEFVSIGDHDGARALIEEVIAESTGELREKAQRALANLN